MIKEDFSHLYAKQEAPVVNSYAATISLNILSENPEIAKETLELLAKSFERFSDIEVIDADLEGLFL